MLPFVAVIALGPLFEYAIFCGHYIWGIAGLLIWTPILWLLLVAGHRAGRVRIWLSGPVALVAYIVPALVFAGAFR